MSIIEGQSQALEKSPLSVSSSINPLDIFKFLFSNWYWYLLSILICVTVGWYVFATTQKMYSCSASVIFKDTQSAAAEARLDRLTGGYYYGGNSNTSNEILQLRSNKLMQDVVKRLGAEVSYVVMDNLRDHYSNSSNVT